MSALAILKESWKNRDKLGDANQTRELAAFLPAALEIQESPPNPLVRWLGLSLIVLVILAILWASFGKVNVVASAEGKIIPSSRVKQIQPLNNSIVKAILVNEGEFVLKGQALVEFDTVLTKADKKRLGSELHSIEMRLSVSQAFLSALGSLDGDNAITISSDIGIELPESTSEKETILYKQLLWQQWLQYKAQLQSLYSSILKSQSEQQASQENIIKLQQTLPIVEKRASILKNLHQQKFSSEHDYLQAEQERIQVYQDLAAEKHRLNQLRAGEGEIKEQVNLHIAQANAAVLSEITDQQRQIISLQEELNKANDLDAKKVLHAPVAGRVQGLAIHTVGGVVTEAQQLMLIVPDEEHLEVEVTLENKDIGFVFENMPAEIKIHTFPFTKYGVIEAEVSNVSGDATLDEQKGLIYRMQLRMEKNTILVKGKEVQLMPGMAVTAEVQIGRRRIIEYFLSPLLRHKEESIRER